MRSGCDRGVEEVRDRAVPAIVRAVITVGVTIGVAIVAAGTAAVVVARLRRGGGWGGSGTAIVAGRAGGGRCGRLLDGGAVVRLATAARTARFLGRRRVRLGRVAEVEAFDRLAGQLSIFWMFSASSLVISV